MDSPFLYNRYVTGQHFIGRKEDCAILGNLLTQSENVVVWGAVRRRKEISCPSGFHQDESERG